MFSTGQTIPGRELSSAGEYFKKNSDIMMGSPGTKSQRKEEEMQSMRTRLASPTGTRKTWEQRWITSITLADSRATPSPARGPHQPQLTHQADHPRYVSHKHLFYTPWGFVIVCYMASLQQQPTDTERNSGRSVLCKRKKIVLFPRKMRTEELI